MKRYLIIRFICATLLILLSASVFAGYGNKRTDTAIGVPGDPGNVSRTLKIVAIEYMFLPPELTVKQGETIKFVIENKGNKKHEMIIDTKRNLKKYAKIHRNDSEIATNEPNHIKLDPGEQKSLVWEFTETGTINFACPIPGHFKGMRGKIYVETK